VAASALNLELRTSSGPAAEGDTFLSGLAVLQAGRWVAICRELGTVAEGETADEALDDLEAAIRDVVEIADEGGLERGLAVPSDEIRRLLLEHEGPAPVTLRTITQWSPAEMRSRVI
jgi:predicted RNase H-like HicB family nuclease